MSKVSVSWGNLQKEANLIIELYCNTSLFLCGDIFIFAFKAVVLCFGSVEGAVNLCAIHVNDIEGQKSMFRNA